MKMRRHKHRQMKGSFRPLYAELANLKRQMDEARRIGRLIGALAGPINRLTVAMFRAFSGIGLRRVRAG